MQEFVALREKMYAYRVYNGKEGKKLKGIKKPVVEKTLTFEDYKTCLFGNGENVYRDQVLIRNEKHKLYTVKQNKIALNRDADKRITNEDGISTKARGFRFMTGSS